MITFKVMKYGDEGIMVADAQKALHRAGSTIKVNGKYSIGMVSAVKAFQKRNKLKVTGQIDAKTMAKLKEYMKPASRKLVKPVKVIDNKK